MKNGSRTLAILGLLALLTLPLALCGCMGGDDNKQTGVAPGDVVVQNPRGDHSASGAVKPNAKIAAGDKN